LKIFITTVIIFISTSIFAQQIDSLQNIISPDSSKKITLLPDSLKPDPKIYLEKTALDNYWKQLQKTNTFDSDSGKQFLFKHENILVYNYNGFADLFRHQPSFQVYDFLEMGLPRFIATFNLLPHQTSFYYDGHLLNDPIHGMFNTRFMTLDGVQRVEEITQGKNSASDYEVFSSGINIQSPSMNFSEPYTRIMFRQGDFGYTDLDISFAQQFSKNVSVYLGGINKIYKGEKNYGFQYRAGMNYRIKDNIYSHTTLNMDREKLNVTNFSAYENYTYRKFRLIPTFNWSTRRRTKKLSCTESFFLRDLKYPTLRCHRSPFSESVM